MDTHSPREGPGADASMSELPRAGEDSRHALAKALNQHAVVAITDIKGRITHANDRFCELSGYSREQLIGQDHRILNSGKHSRRMMRDMWRTILRGKVWHGEFCNRARDGSHYWLQSSIVPVLDEAGAPSQFISLRTEITEQKRTELALAESEARFRRLFEYSSDALLLLDARTRRFIDANRAASELLRLDDPGRIRGNSPQSFSPAQQADGRSSAEAAEAMIATALRQGSHRFEWLHCSDARPPFPVEVLLTAIDLKRQRLLFVTWRDISEQREQQAFAEASSQALDRLARGQALADVLRPLLHYASQDTPGLGLAVLRRPGAGQPPQLAAEAGLSESNRRGLLRIGAEFSHCALLSDGDCASDCERQRCHQRLTELRQQARLRIEPLFEPPHPLQASLLRFEPELTPADSRPGRCGPRWFDLLRLVLEHAHAREQQVLSQAVFLNSAEGVAVCDPQGRILLANPALSGLLGQPGRALVGSTLGDLFEDEPALQRGVEDALAAKGLWQGERSARCAAGRAATWLCSINELRRGADEPPLRILMAADITEHRRQSARIEHLAFFDPLTQLPNRSLLNERLHAEVLRAEREAGGLALIYLDLDRFKEINDSCGHAIGDRVLRDVAARLADSLQPGALLARMGGDEFMVILSTGITEHIEQQAQALIESLQRPISLDGQHFSLHASCGVSVYPTDALDPDDLMKHADIAMYQAKRNGGSVCFYNRELGQSLNRRLLLAARLKVALAERRLRLYLQPQVDLRQRRLVGAEALLRWQEPELGWVSPAEFISVAESSGLMVELGYWVFDKACAQLAEWKRRGLRLPGRLSINLSPLQLADPGFELSCQRALERHRIEPSELELELTESTLVADPEAAIRLFARLTAQGYSLAIDDFGTGYSSLAYLKRFPAARLKIDREFVRDMQEDEGDRAIVEAVIAMARALELETVAEGVETVQQAAALEQIGCQTGQGFLFAPALSAEAFASAWLIDAAQATALEIETE